MLEHVDFTDNIVIGIPVVNIIDDKCILEWFLWLFKVTVYHFIPASFNFSEFHKNKFSVYFMLANGCKVCVSL